MGAPQKHLGLGTGIGLVAGSMIGTGVFVSAGFMAQSLSPLWILSAWVVGAALAGLGAVAYGELCRAIPRSGGEYRYLAALLHPSLGALAGWSSFVFGFSAPLAINALGAAAFSEVLFAHGHPRLVAAAFIALPTIAHALDNRFSVAFQNTFAALKIALVFGFAVVGLSLGETTWPSWSPPESGGFSASAYITGLFFVGFAYSGWNSSVYAASEFRDPSRDVPRSMYWGLAIAAVLYLVVNWVFVVNLSPSEAIAVADENRAVTLGHLIAAKLIGGHGAAIMSVVIVLAFVSAISAITVIGPRVYAEMAADGVLAGWLRYPDDGGRPPTAAVLVQGGAAVALLASHSLRQVLVNASAILLLFTALAAVGLIRLGFSASLQARIGAARPRTGALVCAALYALSSAGMLVFGARSEPTLLLWLAGAAVLAAGSYIMIGARRRERSA